MLTTRHASCFTDSRLYTAKARSPPSDESVPGRLFGLVDPHVIRSHALSLSLTFAISENAHPRYRLPDLPVPSTAVGITYALLIDSGC